MCSPGQPAVPSCAGDAVAMAQAGLAWLAGMDAGSVPAVVLADCLRGLEQAESMQVAARSSVLAGFTAQGGQEDDGHGSARAWLKWQTRVTGGAAAGAVGWMRRLCAHRAVCDALAAGQVSGSWARCICDWTDVLPADLRDHADVILLGAVAGGAELADLAGLAGQMRARSARPDTDTGDGGEGFDDRRVRLDQTLGGAGSLQGELTPQCAAAVRAVLDALGNRQGRADVRSKGQRDHDALHEAMRRLIAAGCLPDRAGQPVHIQLSMTLDQLRGLPGGPAAETAWTTGTGIPGAPAAGPGDDCDAAFLPVVTGHVDHGILDALAAALLAAKNSTSPGTPGGPGPGTPGGPGPGTPLQPGQWRAERAARQIILAHAAQIMSGPGGLASYLRGRLPENIIASVSLPLDIGAITESIPVHLRRAVTARDRRCRFPGCDQPVAACQPHHILPRAKGGPDQPDQPDAVVQFPPPDRRAPVGLGHCPEPRRHRDRGQPGQAAHPAQPRTPRHHRLTGGGNRRPCAAVMAVTGGRA